MAKLSIKVVVGGRTYPLSVNETEKERVLKAAEDINKSIKMLKENYAVKDMQDLLAMTALEYSSDLIVKSGKVEQEKSSEKLTLLNQRLADYLNS